MILASNSDSKAKFDCLRGLFQHTTEDDQIAYDVAYGFVLDIFEMAFLEVFEALKTIRY